jgi:hypothetical protein
LHKFLNELCFVSLSNAWFIGYRHSEEDKKHAQTWDVKGQREIQDAVSGI